ncbi:MAG: hypothetical protein ACOCXA_02060 [Planctomycetota bacterium]
MHEWLHAYRWLVLLITLPGIVYAGYLYWRWWQSRHQTRDHGPLSTGRPKTQTLGAGMKPPRDTSISGEQEDLRQALDATTIGDPSHQAKAMATTNVIHRTPPAGAEQAGQEVLDRLDALLDEDEDEDAGQGGDLDTSEKWRTTRAMAADKARRQLDPAIDDATSANRPAVAPESPDADQQRHALETDGLQPEDLQDQEPGSSAIETPPAAAPATDPIRPRRRMSDDEAAAYGLRSANRMEELHLHVGIDRQVIDKAKLAPPPGKVVDRNVINKLPEAQQQRLEELGLVADAGSKQGSGAQRRLDTDELDGILDQLDQVLDEDDSATDDQEANAAGKPTTAPVNELPAWARVDTFDEDLEDEDEDEAERDDDEDSGPKQQSLFN